MKFSEKLGYLLQGKTEEEIAAIEASEEEKLKKEAEESSENARLKSALEEAASMVKELEDKLQEKESALKAKDDELSKLNQDFADLNNKQTVKDEPIKRDSAADVFSQLFNNKKEEK